MIKGAIQEHGGSLNEYTVLSSSNDPYRLDRPSKHEDGRWFLEQLERLDLLERKLHLRGIHYALLGSTAMPNGKPYSNTNEHWEWLQNDAAKAARWLGYVPFDAITDARNEPPVILVQPYSKPDAWVTVDPDITLPSIEDLKPSIYITFEGRQAYRLALYGEKTSLGPVLRPIAERYKADLYLPTGEISDTQMYTMASNAAKDGRPLIVFTIADFDPSGWQMSVSIGRKLQGLRDLYFRDLEFELHPVAMTLDQVEDLDLPSTPLKETERRADKWREVMGREQTEVDALATLRPDELTRIVRNAMDPFYDHSLSRRTWEARTEWEALAQDALDEQLTETHRAALFEELEDRLADIRKQLSEIENQARLSTEDLDLDLPPIEVPEPVVDEGMQGKPLISSSWSWTDQTERPVRRKRHGESKLSKRWDAKGE